MIYINKMTNNVMSREIFLSIYNKLPEIVRDEVIVVIDDISYTWNECYPEVSNNTQLGKKIIKRLKDLGII